MKLLLFSILLFSGLLAAYGAAALSEADIVFPIAELGNCESEEACKSYCDDPAHFDACIAFVEEYNILSPEELAKAKQFRQFEDEIGEGPGGCTSQAECEAYCNDVTHIEECVAFGEEHGLMGEEELKEARMVMQALQQGAQLPGGCQNEAECEAYCADPNHMPECIAFAETAGFMSPEELREAKQVQKAIEAGVSPPNCRGRQECDAYCEAPEHMEECVEFGLAAGLIPPEEAEIVQRMLPLMEAGKVPEACMGGKEECEAYCAEEENIDECTAFFVEAGFMSPEDAEMFKKTGGRGPGGCQSEQECDAFCNNSQNQEICFEFAKEHGLISEDELRNMKEGVRQFQDWFATAPPEVAQCLKEQVGEEVLQEIQAGTFMPGPELINNLEQCFQLQQQIAENQMRECLSKSCDEFFSCMGAISQQGGGPGGGGPDDREHGQEGQGGGFGGGALEQEIQAKMDACMQAQFEQDQQNFFPSEGGEGFSPQQFEEGEQGFFSGDFQGGSDGQFPGERPEGDFVPEEFQRLIPEGFDNFTPQENEGSFKREHEDQFQDQFQQTIPIGDEVIVFPPQDSPGEFHQKQGEPQEQFAPSLEPEPVHEIPGSAESEFQGNILEAAARLFLRLVPR